MYDLQSFYDYLTYEKHYSSHTVDAYRRDLRSYQQFLVTHCGLNNLIEAQHIHIRSWIVQLMNDQYTPKSINRKLSAVKSCYKYLKKQGQISANPAGKVSGPKISKRLPQVIRKEEFKVGLEEQEHMSFSDVRDLLIVEMLYQTGMRRSELIGLSLSDIDTRRRELKVLGKGNKERVIPISGQLQKRIDNYLVERNKLFGKEVKSFFVTDKGKKLYPKFVYLVAKRWISRHSTVEKRSPHIFRHSFATHLADNGAELNAIKDLLGHANLSATQIYTHNSISRLKEVYEKAHPKGV